MAMVGEEKSQKVTSRAKGGSGGGLPRRIRGGKRSSKQSVDVEDDGRWREKTRERRYLKCVEKFSKCISTTDTCTHICFYTAHRLPGASIP